MAERLMKGDRVEFHDGTEYTIDHYNAFGGDFFVLRDLNGGFHRYTSAQLNERIKQNKGGAFSDKVLYA